MMTESLKHAEALVDQFTAVRANLLGGRSTAEAAATIERIMGRTSDDAKRLADSLSSCSDAEFRAITDHFKKAVEEDAKGKRGRLELTDEADTMKAGGLPVLGALAVGVAGCAVWEALKWGYKKLTSDDAPEIEVCRAPAQ